jgi:hypothetical protein
MDFKLDALILIDSYSEGRIVELPLDGGVVITGRNGRGKTTLLQLIPIFFGASPNEIVPSKANRLDFDAFYLPRQTSYVIYAYRRGTDARMVVLHAPKSEGGRRRYRFVRSGYRQDLFLLDGGTRILQAPELTRHFHMMNVDHSPSLSSVEEYRSIIQGRSRSGKDALNHRKLVADYAFVGAGHHLTHIDKIVAGMFLRRTDFGDLKKMVVSCVAEDSTSGAPEKETHAIVLQGQREKIAAWPEDYDAYASVMREEPRLGELLEHEARLVAIEAEMGCLHARALGLRDALEEALGAHRHEEERHVAEATSEQTAHRETTAARRGDAERSRLEAESAENAVRALEERHAQWLADDLPAKGALLDREEPLRADHAVLKEQHDTLIGKQRTVSDKYARILIDHDRSAHEADASAQRKRDALKEGFAPRFSALETALKTRRQALEREHKSAQAGVQARLSSVVEHKGACSERARNPQADPGLLQAEAAARDALETQRNALHVGEEALAAARKDLAQAKGAHREADARLRDLNGARDALTQQRQRLIAQENPSPASLLTFLRINRPDWAFDLAKVVREDLLAREDLEPELIETLPACYGVGLALSAVDASLAADEAGLRAAIDALNAEHAGAERLCAEAERALADADRLRKARHDEELKANAALLPLQARSAAAQVALNAAKQRVVQGRTKAKEAADAALAAAQSEEAAVRSDLEALIETYERSCADLEETSAAQKRALEHDRDTVLGEHDAEQAAQQGRRAAERAAIEANRDRDLASGGIDTAALSDLEKRILACANALERARSCRNEVSQWRNWLANEWTSLEGTRQKAGAARTRERAARNDIAKAEAHWKVRAAALEEKAGALKHERLRLEDELNRVRERLKDTFGAFTADPETLAQPYDPAWTLRGLIGQANTHKSSMLSIHKGIGERIDALKRTFTAARGTPPDQFFELHRQTLGPEAPARQWIPIFATWFESEHLKYQRILAVDARQIADGIAHFHRSLADFQNKIEKFNRELQRSLDDSLAFDSVKRVAVQVVSRIREEAYWEPIEAIAKEQRTWSGMAGVDLPPPAFATTLRGLLERWTVREGIRAVRTSLIDIKGEVMENDRIARFSKAEDLANVSSHGLSYLILCVIFIAFINRIRRDKDIEIVWCLDELKDLDLGNIEALLGILGRNAITLVSAFPDPDTDVLALFRHRFIVADGRRLQAVLLEDAQDVQDVPAGHAPTDTTPEIWTPPDAVVGEEFSHV